MTHKEAFEILRDTAIDIRSTREDDILTLYATAQLIALDCIEKQIPKKPHVIRAKVIHADSETKWEYIECPYCPSCGTYLTIYQGCPNNECRQAIDWSEVTNE